MTAVLGAIAGLGAIASLLYGVFKWVAWKTMTTPEETKEAIDQKIAEEKKKVEETGRPQ